jgi:hypothetical protein
MERFALPIQLVGPGSELLWSNEGTKGSPQEDPPHCFGAANSGRFFSLFIHLSKDSNQARVDGKAVFFNYLHVF